MADTDGLIELERIAGALLANMDSSGRRRIFRAMARDLRASQSARIGAQQNPDGSAFEPRRPKSAPRGRSYPLRFLYPKSAAAPRVVFMKSWVRQGQLITGYDIERGDIRSFFWDKIEKRLPVEASDAAKPGGSLRRRGAIRRAAMFRKLRGGKYLRPGASDVEIWVGFANRAAEVAGIHQKGLEDRPALKAAPVRYPRRELLGLTNAERGRMLDLLLAHLEIRK
ncbi:MAG TPA: phage virion morphogenesis protein [Sphingobium sp.]|nr:phage virion morphogenesis protein [Sphingobium sp.]